MSTDNGHIALFLSSKLTELSHSPKSENSRDHAYELAQMVAPTLSCPCSTTNGGGQMFGPQHTIVTARSNPACGPTRLIPTWYGQHQQFCQSARSGEYQKNVKSMRIAQQMSSTACLLSREFVYFYDVKGHTTGQFGPCAITILTWKHFFNSVHCDRYMHMTAYRQVIK
eukprot:scaffold104578_cov67-Attheya_sp.AAC.12